MYLLSLIDVDVLPLLVMGGVLAVGAALELVTMFDTAPNTAAFQTMAAATGNSLTVRFTELSKMIRLLSVWADFQGEAGAASLRIKSPKFHDNVQGLRFDLTASELEPVWPMGLWQRLWPQDALTVECLGSNTAADIETACMLIHYEDLPGTVARLISADELKRRAVSFTVVENTLALGTTGGYSGEEAINAEFDQFKANTDYALVGYGVDVECAAVRWRGADTGNLGIGGPGHAERKGLTGRWFLELSEKTGLACIPVFNSANRGGILIDGAQDENGTDVTVSSIFAELAA